MRSTGRLACLLMVLAFPGHVLAVENPPPSEENLAARRAFQDKKFGLFVHWGVDSLLSKGEMVMERDRLPIVEYEKLPPRFNPTEFDAEAWARAAKAAGMKYITVTAKHHDGFCIFDSKLTRYDVVDATPFAKDPLKLLADACRRNNLALSFSYSLLDWHHPDYFPPGRSGKFAGREPKGDWKRYVAYYQGQVRELCTNYGPIGGIRFEGLWDKPDADWGLSETYQLIHKLQPRALIGNNHRGAPMPGEDLQIFEREMPGENRSANDPALPLEMCETLNTSWGFRASDTKDKSAEDVIRLLVNAAGRNANLLLNVAPRPDGAIPKASVDRLAEVGRWLETRGVSIYGTRAGPVGPSSWGVATVRADDAKIPTIFLHVLDPIAPVKLPTAMMAYSTRVIGNDAISPRLAKLGGSAQVLLLPADRQPIDTVVELVPNVLAPPRQPAGAIRR